MVSSPPPVSRHTIECSVHPTLVLSFFTPRAISFFFCCTHNTTAGRVYSAALRLRQKLQRHDHAPPPRPVSLVNLWATYRLHLAPLLAVTVSPPPPPCHPRRAKLFIFGETLLNKGTGQKEWVERGIGEVKFLQ